MFYYRGLKEWNNEKGYLTDTCLTAQDKYCLLYTSAIKNSAGEPVAVLAVDTSMREMEGVFLEYARSIAIAGILNALVFFVMLYLWIRNKVIQPIKKLDASANAFVKSSHKGLQPEELNCIDPEIHSEDEMQTLSDSLMTLSNDIKKYMGSLLSETKEKERIESELSLSLIHI